MFHESVLGGPCASSLLAPYEVEAGWPLGNFSKEHTNPFQAFPCTPASGCACA
jgi:hypothetical protein